MAYEPTPSELPPPIAEGGECILIVDEDDERRATIADRLRGDDMLVDELTRGESVVDRVLADPPDLVLLDVHIPGQNGFQVCRALRQHDALRAVPIILMSSIRIDEDSVVAGLLSGADDYIDTPARVAELKARIRVQLRNRQDRQALRVIREQRNRFRHQAMRDALTGIPNRRAADDAVGRALRENRPLAVALVDIDHFKRVNDTHGHAAGDAVLKRVAHILDLHTRQGDLAARYGGEEFMLLLHDVQPLHIESIAERFRRAVEQLHVDAVPGLDSVTVSLGLGAWNGTARKPHAAELIELADSSLYEAKNAGRNRCVCSWLEVTENSSDVPPQMTETVGQPSSPPPRTAVTPPDRR